MWVGYPACRLQVGVARGSRMSRNSAGHPSRGDFTPVRSSFHHRLDPTHMTEAEDTDATASTALSRAPLLHDADPWGFQPTESCYRTDGQKRLQWFDPPTAGEKSAIGMRRGRMGAELQPDIHTKVSNRIDRRRELKRWPDAAGQGAASPALPLDGCSDGANNGNGFAAAVLGRSWNYLFMFLLVAFLCAFFRCLLFLFVALVVFWFCFFRGVVREFCSFCFVFFVGGWLVFFCLSSGSAAAANRVRKRMIDSDDTGEDALFSS